MRWYGAADVFIAFGIYLTGRINRIWSLELLREQEKSRVTPRCVLGSLGNWMNGGAFGKVEMWEDMFAVVRWSVRGEL